MNTMRSPHSSLLSPRTRSGRSRSRSADDEPELDDDDQEDEEAICVSVMAVRPALRGIGLNPVRVDEATTSIRTIPPMRMTNRTSVRAEEAEEDEDDPLTTNRRPRHSGRSHDRSLSGSTARMPIM
jgi:hypothetical protein